MMSTKNYSDEILMAYVDGELDDEMCRQLEEALTENQLLQTKLRRFQHTGKSLARSYDSILQMPIPEKISSIFSDEVGETANRNNQQRYIERLISWLRDTIAPRPIWRQAAYGLGLVTLGIGIGIFGYNNISGFSVSTQALFEIDNNQIIARGALYRLLDSSISGETRDMADGITQGASLTAIATFKDQRNRYCRQFTVTGQSVSQIAGIACRTSTGHWILEYQMAIVENDHQSNEFKPAANSSGGSLVDDIVTQLSGNAILELDVEEVLIRQGWR